MVYFLAAWSPACKHLSPILDRLSEFTDHVDFEKVDVVEVNEAMGEFEVMEVSVTCILIASAGPV